MWSPVTIFTSTPTINRPHALLAHPDGRHLILTGTPAYGKTGGGMLIHNLETGKSTLLEHTELIVNQATYTLIALPDGNILGGTTIRPGSGGITIAKEAELYIFDFKTRKIVWRQVALPGVKTIRDLVMAPDGLVYGLADRSTFFVFDPAARNVVHKENVTAYGNLSGRQAPRIMLVGPDKMVYAYFQKGIVRFTPATFKHEMVAESPVAIAVGIVLHAGRFYFANGSRVWSYQMPGW